MAVTGVSAEQQPKILAASEYRFNGETPIKADGGNYFRHDELQAQLRGKTEATPTIDTVEVSVDGSNASQRDRQAFDIAGKPVGASGFKLVKGSDMETAFVKINSDDFSEEEVTDFKTKKQEKRWLFNPKTTDGKMRLFSSEKGKDGAQQYGIVDYAGKAYRFSADGKLISVEDPTK